MLWAGLHFPYLALECFAIGATPGPQPPLVLADDRQVLAADEQARARGIQPGCALATAWAICPELRCVDHSPAHVHERLQQVATRCLGLTPAVSLDPPDGVVLEVRASLQLFGGLDAFRQQLARLLDATGNRYQLAWAGTPSAALLLARCRIAMPPDADPAVLDRHVHAALQQVPVDALPVTPHTRQAMTATGLRTIGQLFALPRDELAPRLGAALLARLDQLTGARADPRPFLAAEVTFLTTRHFLEDVTNLQVLLFPMRPMLAELTQWLRTRQLATGRLHWIMTHPSRPPWTLEVRSAVPRSDGEALFELSRMALEHARNLPAETASLQLAVRDLQPACAVSAPLLAEFAQARGADELFLDRLRNRLGEAPSILGLAEDHRPERAWRTRTPGGPVPAARPARAPARADGRGDGPGDGRGDAGAARLRTRRPVWLLEQPQPVRLARFTLLQGPERIDAAWWEGESPRDYYIARRHDGALCWLFRDPRAGRWYLHGLFG